MIENILVLLVIASIVVVSIAKIITDKRKGVQCPGCPYGKSGECQCGCVLESCSESENNSYSEIRREIAD